MTVFLLLFPSLYLPFLWLPFEQGPWDAKRWFWLKSLPALPGIFVQTLGILDSLAPAVSYTAMSVATLALLIIACLIGRQSRGSLVFSFFLLIVISGWNSWLAYQSFHNI
ncbi:MAG: hypothetical protein WCO60_06635 [Verrucomicrobiota bacterium]